MAKYRVYSVYSYFIHFIVLSCLSLNIEAQTLNPKFTLVGKNNAGVEGKQAFLVRGENYKLPKEFAGSEEALTGNFGSSIIYAFDELDINADYQLEVMYMADGDRTQHISADGNAIHGPIKLEKKKYACQYAHSQQAAQQLPSKHITVQSDGKQAWRAWLNEDKIQFLVADFVSPGFKMFLGSYYAPYRKPLKQGDIISGKVTVRLE